LPRIPVGDLDAVGFADRNIVEPLGGLGHIFVRIES
jgi:hypothetical protein